MIKTIQTVLIVSLFGLAAASSAQEAENEKDCKNDLECKSSWVALSEKQKRDVFSFSEGYKTFLDKARTELSFVSEAVKIAKNKGFRALTEKSSIKPGRKYYDVNRDRSVSLIVIGKEELKQGFRVIGAHIDSPRLELKAKPLYEKENFAIFQTSVHGGIKVYQWTNIPLALTGRVDKKDGSVVHVDIGMNDKDPIFIIADMSPHTDRGYDEKKVKDQIKHEELDPIVGHIPSASGKDVQGQVLQALKEKYNISRADLVSAELALVPSFKSRDVGFDRGLVAAYGQDDRLAAYASLMAITNMPIPAKTSVAYLVDNEEVGNVNNTGAKSVYFTNLLARLLHGQMDDDYSEYILREATTSSKMISIDVNPGINPKNPTGFEKSNAPRLGFGINLKMYGRGFNANSEYTAQIRNMLDVNDIPWQTVTYKVGARGGGTIGGEFSRLNMDVVDFGVPVLSIHTTYAVSSKVDVFNLHRAAKAFFSQ